MCNEKLMAKSLSIDELNQVAGGNMDQTMCDMALFEIHAGLKLYTAKIHYLCRDWPKPDANSVALLKEAFKKFGVDADIQLGSGKIGENIYNDYYINNELVTREEVWAHIKAQLKK